MYVRRSEANIIKISETLFSGLYFNGDQKIVDDDVIIAMVMKITIQITLMIAIVTREMKDGYEGDDDDDYDDTDNDNEDDNDRMIMI